MYKYLCLSSFIRLASTANNHRDRFNRSSFCLFFPSILWRYSSLPFLDAFDDLSSRFNQRGLLPSFGSDSDSGTSLDILVYLLFNLL
jgi:hypothetical protein